MTLARVETRAHKARLEALLERYGGLLLFLVLAALPPIFFGGGFYMSIFVTIAIYGIVVVSLDLLMGYGGLLSFGHNGFFALGAYVMGVLAAKLGVPLLIGILAAVAANLILALVIGAATLRLKEYYFAVATLGFGVIVVQVLGGLVEFTGGWSGLTGVPRLSVFGFTLVSDMAFYVVSVVGLLISLVIGRNLVNSRFGRAVRAFGNDELSSSMLGIPVARYKIQLFMVTSVFASLAGSLYGLYLRVVTPANFDIPTMVDMVLMLFLGGKETLWGAVLGAAILRTLPELMGPFQDFKTMLQGLIFILILMFMPAGLAGVIKHIWRSLRARGVVPSLAGSDEPKGRAATPGQAQGAFVPRAVAPRAGPLLDASHLGKRFRGLRAVNDLSFAVQAGQLKAIIGPNGAGKTTLFNLLTHVIPPDEGQISFNGANLASAKPHDVARLGMARTFQTPRLFASMTVLENVMVGHHTRLGSNLLGCAFPSRSVRAEERHVVDSSWDLLHLVGLEQRAHQPADKLPFGERRLLEIARALAVQPYLLLLDEPAAGLNETEKDRLGDLLLRLKASGLTMVLVEHDMRLVMRLADEVLVINYGERIAEGTPAEVQRDQAVLSAYLGEEAVHAGR